MTAIYLFIPIIVIIFLPIPIKICAVYDNSILALRVYNHKINLQTKSEIEENVKETLSMDAHIKPILEFLSTNKFKPSLKLKTDLVYGLGDAAYTAIFYGVIHTIYPFLIQYISNFVKIKNTKLNINPEFNDTILNLKINCIIFISLTQLIYIGFNLLKILKEKHIFK